MPGRNLFALGVVLGLMTSLVHGVSGLVLTELALVIMCLLLLRRRLPIRAALFFVIGVGLVNSLRLLGAADAGAVPGEISFAGAELVISNAYMVFPWQNSTRSSLFENGFFTTTPEVFFLTLLAGHVLLTGILLVVNWRQPRRSWVFLLASVQLLYMTLLIDVGWLPILLLVYIGHRLWKNTFDAVDYWLIVGIGLTLLIGPLQQLVIYTIVQLTESVTLTGLVFELVRFSIFVYIPFYILLGRAFLWIVSPMEDLIPRLGAIMALAYVSWRNLKSVPYPIADQIDDGQLLLLAGLGLLLTSGWWRRVELQPDAARIRQYITLSATLLAAAAAIIWLRAQNLYAPHVIYLTALGVWLLCLALAHSKNLRSSIAVLALLIYLGLLGMILLPRQQAETASGAFLPLRDALALSQDARDALAPPVFAGISPEYLDMTQWVQDHTPPDSLFHLVYPLSSFRYHAQRPLLVGNNEVSYGLYIGKDPLELNDLRLQLHSNIFGLQTTVAMAGDLGADYIVAYHDRRDLPASALGEASVYQLQTVYENPTYRVYQINRIPYDEPPLDMQNVLDEFHPSLGLPDDAVIFNPATGSLTGGGWRHNNRFINAILRNLPDQSPEDLRHLLEFMFVLDRMSFQSPRGSDDFNAIQNWRDTKRPEHLREAGIAYLIFDDVWASFLSGDEMQVLSDLTHYELVAQWTLASNRSFYLYQVKM